MSDKVLSSVPSEGAILASDHRPPDLGGAPAPPILINEEDARRADAKRTDPSHRKRRGWRRLTFSGPSTPLMQTTSLHARTPADSKVRVRSKARHAAVYYGECSLQKIPAQDADDAVQESHDLYQKWWIEKRMRQGRGTSGGRKGIVYQVSPASRVSTVAAPCWISSRNNDNWQNNSPMKNCVSAHGDRAIEQPIKRRQIVDSNSKRVTCVSHAQYEPKSNVSSSGMSSRGKSNNGCGSRQVAQNLGNRAALNSMHAGSFSADQTKNDKMLLLNTLEESCGDVTTAPFLLALNRLTAKCQESQWDARQDPRMAKRKFDIVRLEGLWCSMSKPKYLDCIGKNEAGDCVYSLGRMSFDMFRPTDLLCSIQGVFNAVRVVNKHDFEEVLSVPRSLQVELRNGKSILRTYNVVTAFTIEPYSAHFGPDSPNISITRPIRGIMTTYGYALPDPSVVNRLSVWFTGGTLEVNDEKADASEWKRIFGDALPKWSLKERARVLAAKLLLGASPPESMERDGTMNYSFRRPIGGHGSHFVDALYMDESTRIMRGHHGSVYVFSRVPSIDSGFC